MIVVVKKKHATWQLYIDYQALNKTIMTKRYLIPHIDYLLDHIKGANLFMKFDLKFWYHQVPINPLNVLKIDFKSKKRLFKSLFMYFGLTNAPLIFISMMNDALMPLIDSFVVVYLDDILIFGKKWNGHFQHIEQMLSTL